MKKLYLLFLLFIPALTSCKDEKENPSPQPDAKAVSFNFRLDPLPEETKDFELIISQKDGEVLLDTMLAARRKHELKVNSEDTKFNVTTIYSNPATKKYAMRTYVQVNPDGWHIDDRLNDRVNIRDDEEGEPMPSKVYYSNAVNFKNHDSSGEIQFGAIWVNLHRESFLGMNLDTIRIEYDRQYENDLSYLLLPGFGKYIFAEVTAPVTHVDFSSAGTAIKRKYNTPASVLGLTVVLQGFTRAGDYSKPIMLYLSNRNTKEYDLQFPQTVIEEFELRLIYQQAGGYTHEYWHVGTTVPEEMPFLSKPDFKVTKSLFNDFQVEYGEDKPSTCTLLWRSWNENLIADWQVFLSPGETAFNMESFAGRLSLHALEGKDLSGFRLIQAATRTATGYTHQTMHDYLNDPDAYLRKEQKQYRRMYVFF